MLCGTCVKVCPETAIRIETGAVHIDRATCTACGVCVSACAHNALRIIGEWMSCAAVAEECLRDKPFYEESAGGITLTGGEPTFQPEFSATVLAEAQRASLVIVRI